MERRRSSWGGVPTLSVQGAPVVSNITVEMNKTKHEFGHGMETNTNWSFAYKQLNEG